MGCHSARYGTMERMRSGMRLATQSFSAGHMMLMIRVYDEAGNVAETHEHADPFKER
jgi:hypothetical protein